MCYSNGYNGYSLNNLSKGPKQETIMQYLVNLDHSYKNLMVL